MNVSSVIFKGLTHRSITDDTNTHPFTPLRRSCLLCEVSELQAELFVLGGSIRILKSMQHLRLPSLPAWYEATERCAKKLFPHKQPELAVAKPSSSKAAQRKASHHHKTSHSNGRFRDISHLSCCFSFLCSLNNCMITWEMGG